MEGVMAILEAIAVPMMGMCAAALGVLALLAALVIGVRAARFRASAYCRATGSSFLKTYRNDGAWGEYLLSREVERTDPTARQFFNAYVPCGDDGAGTSEVDCICVSPSGVYVFENKNYAGLVFGNEKDKTWCQVLAGGRIKNRFYNPIRQNATHLRELACFLGVGDDTLIGAVTFNDRATLKKVTVSSMPVLSHAQVGTWIKKTARERGQRLDAAEMDRICALLQGIVNVSDEVKRAHVARIESKGKRV